MGKQMKFTSDLLTMAVEYVVPTGLVPRWYVERMKVVIHTHDPYTETDKGNYATFQEVLAGTPWEQGFQVLQSEGEIRFLIEQGEVAAIVWNGAGTWDLYVLGEIVTSGLTRAVAQRQVNHLLGLKVTPDQVYNALLKRPDLLHGLIGVLVAHGEVKVASEWQGHTTNSVRIAHLGPTIGAPIGEYRWLDGNKFQCHADKQHFEVEGSHETALVEVDRRLREQHWILIDTD